MRKIGRKEWWVSSFCSAATSFRPWTEWRLQGGLLTTSPLRYDYETPVSISIPVELVAVAAFTFSSLVSLEIERRGSDRHG
jgi:hypothetical protein